MPATSFLRPLLALAATAALGTASLPAAAAPEPILISVPAPFSGPNATLGHDIREGILTAMEALNAAGGLQGRPYEAVFIDDGCDAAQAQKVARQVISTGSGLAIGHVCSDVAMLTAPLYEQANVVAITPGATAPEVTDKHKGHYFFRVVGRDDAQGPFAASVITTKLNPASIAIVHDGQAYGQGIAQQLAQDLKKFGAPVVLTEEIAPDQADYAALIEKLKQANPALVFFGGYHPEMGRILRQARQAQISATFMGPEGVYSEELVDIAGPAVEGLLFTHPADFSQNPENQAVVQQFKKAKRSADGIYQMMSYAAMQVLHKSLQAVGPDSKKVADYMHTSYFDTVIGPVSFTKNGDIKRFKFVVFALDKQGKRKPL